MNAPLAPSSAPRWEQCAGSVALAARYPEDDTPESLAGTAAHWAAFEVASCRQVDVGVIAPNGVVLTEEMCDGADIYAETIAARMTSTSSLNLETTIPCKTIHEHCWGTPDAWIVDRASRRLTVLDYKFGHRLIDPFEAWQLVAYTSGIIDLLDLTGLDDQHWTVRLAIIQPRGYHRDGPVRCWDIRMSDLRPYFNRLATSAAAAMEPGATCTAGPECDYCPGRHACETLQRSAYRVADLASASVPLDLSDDAMARELQLLQRSADLLKARITGLSAQVQGALRAGRRVPGYALQQDLGRERWARPIDEVITLGQMLGIDVSKPGAITPKQAVAKGLTADVVQMYSETPLGEVKLVADGTKLAAVFGGAARTTPTTTA